MHISKLLYVLPYLINLILHDRTVTQLALGKSARDAVGAALIGWHILTTGKLH